MNEEKNAHISSSMRAIDAPEKCTSDRRNSDKGRKRIGRECHNMHHYDMDGLRKEKRIFGREQEKKTVDHTDVELLEV